MPNWTKLEYRNQQQRAAIGSHCPAIESRHHRPRKMRFKLESRLGTLCGKQTPLLSAFQIIASTNVFARLRAVLPPICERSRLETNHQGLGNRLIVSDFVSNTSDTIRRRERLGEMLNYYYRPAA